VIRSFGDKQTEALFADRFVRAFQDVARRAKRKLEAVNAASRFEDLAVPPSNRLEKLKGDLNGFHAIRINDSVARDFQVAMVMRSRSGSLTTTRRGSMKNEFAPVTPGEMLKEEFLTEYGLSQNQLAKAIGISPNRIADIVNNRRRITADTALRLGLYFGNSPEFG
jgi:proteic killer suppression protein